MLIARYRYSEIWFFYGEYYVYGRTADPYVTASEGHAREVAASVGAP